MQVKSKLKGHQKRVTGLAFSNVLNVLVSSGADSQVCLYAAFALAVIYSPSNYVIKKDLATAFICRVISFLIYKRFYLYSFVYGAWMDGKNKLANRYKFQAGIHQIHLLIHAFSSIKTRYMYLLSMPAS